MHQVDRWLGDGGAVRCRRGSDRDGPSPRRGDPHDRHRRHRRRRRRPTTDCARRLACGATTAIRVDAPDDMDSDSVAAALTTRSSPTAPPSGAATTPPTAAPAACRRSSPLVFDVNRHSVWSASSSSIRCASLAASMVDAARSCASPARRCCPSRARWPACAVPRCARRSTAQKAEVLPYGTTVAAGRQRSGGHRAALPTACPSPAGTRRERLRSIGSGSLTDASAAPQPGETVEATPAAAAQRIIEVLRDWGYLS